jgi:hypothetical protein
MVERRRWVIVEEAAMLARVRRRHVGFLLHVEASSWKQRPVSGKEEATSKKVETMPSNKVEVRRGWAVVTSTTSRHSSVVEVRGRAAVPSKLEMVPSKVEEASMQVEHARQSVAQSSLTHVERKE